MAAAPQQISEEKARLYAAGSVRDDLNDAEAEVLLRWAEAQIDRLAQQEGDFSQHNRFLRQLLARIDRLIGQRPFLDEVGHAQHVAALMKALAISGFSLSEAQVLAALPSDRADVPASLHALLNLLSSSQPPLVVQQSAPPPLPPARTWLEEALRYRSELTGDPHEPS